MVVTSAVPGPRDDAAAAPLRLVAVTHGAPSGANREAIMRLVDGVASARPELDVAISFVDARDGEPGSGRSHPVDEAHDRLPVGAGGRAVRHRDEAERRGGGVVGNPESLVEESHENGLLEYPSYTKPAEWRGLEVPPVLRSGNHGAVATWRHEQQVERTRRVRPELLGETGDGEVTSA